MLRFKITKGLLISLLTFLLILSSVCFIFAAQKEVVVLSINDYHTFYFGEIVDCYKL